MRRKVKSVAVQEAEFGTNTIAIDADVIVRDACHTVTALEWKNGHDLLITLSSGEYFLLRGENNLAELDRVFECPGVFYLDPSDNAWEHSESLKAYMAENPPISYCLALADDATGKEVRLLIFVDLDFDAEDAVIRNADPYDHDFRAGDVLMD